MSEAPVLIEWEEGGEYRHACWRSLAGTPPPRRVVVADDGMAADVAFRLVSEGSALLWRGDFQNARQLLQAIARRIERRAARAKPEAVTTPEGFHRYRLARAQRARTLGMLLLPFDADHGLPLRRAPNVAAACREAHGMVGEAYVASLRELLGIIGAHEWRRKGIAVPALAARIHPHYGVFAPVRGEYVELLATAPLPAGCKRAFDVGTGTGVLAAVLARRGVGELIATDCDSRALDCARENIARLHLDDRVQVVAADLYPPGQANLVVCNPPWLPGKPGTPLERAVYDPGSRMLRGFLNGLAAHLAAGGEGWLILSDLAELLGMRTRADLLSAFAAARLTVAGRLDARPGHPRAADSNDALHAARAREITSLWRLRA